MIRKHTHPRDGRNGLSSLSSLNRDRDVALDTASLRNAVEPLCEGHARHGCEAFGDTDLPSRVDIVDWHVIGSRFRAFIEAEGVPLVEGGRPRPA